MSAGKGWGMVALARTSLGLAVASGAGIAVWPPSEQPKVSRRGVGMMMALASVGVDMATEESRAM